MQILKQTARRWLSGFLALIMIVGLIPATGLLTTAYAAGGVPDSIELNKADYADAGSFTCPELPSSKPKYNHTAWMRVFYMDVGGQEVPGFCASHDYEMSTKSHTEKWSNGESIRTAEGGKYAQTYNIIKAYCADYMLSRYIVEVSGIPESPANETKLQQWAHDNGYGYYAYQSNWTLQLASGYAQGAAWLAGAGLFTDNTDEAQLAQIAKIMMRAYNHMHHPAADGSTNPDNASAVQMRVDVLKNLVANGVGNNPASKEFADQITDIYIYYPANKDIQPIIVPIIGDTGAGQEAWLKVKKVDQDGAPIPGVTFTVYKDNACTAPASQDKEGTMPATMTTDANGEAAVKVYWSGSSPTKTFWVKETGPAAGYNGSTSAYDAPLNSLITRMKRALTWFAAANGKTTRKLLQISFTRWMRTETASAQVRSTLCVWRTAPSLTWTSMRPATWCVS